MGELGDRPAATVRAASRHRGLAPGRISLRAAPGGASAPPAAFEGQERFVAYVAHELRAPVALQRTLVEVALADPDADSAELREMGERVLASCEQQQRLIDALLDLTRSRCGLARRDPVDLAVVAAEAMRRHVGCGLDCVVTLEPAQTIGDSDLVERLVANLVSNAIRHNIGGGRIEVATRAASGRAVLSVANTGPLIPAGELRRLFQPFQRLAPRFPDNAEGVGLGLAVVQAIADAHDAVITAQAQPGGGLRIDVGFPRLHQASRQQAAHRRV